MNHNDYLAQLEKDPEYVAAREALRLHFALGDAVIVARLKRGWSQTELARRVGTKQANISRIEAAIANPTLELVKKLIDVLGLEVRITPLSATTTSATVSSLPLKEVPLPIPAPVEWLQKPKGSSTGSVHSNWRTGK